MSDTSKQGQKADLKPEEQKKAEAALEDKQLDQVSGGTLYEVCATGKHFPTVKLP